MTTPKSNTPAVIELGQASTETKGNAIFGRDGSGGELQYVTGMADG